MERFRLITLVLTAKMEFDKLHNIVVNVGKSEVANFNCNRFCDVFDLEKQTELMFEEIWHQRLH